MNSQEELTQKIEDSIAKMAEQARACPDSQKALHFSQAALNLSHTRLNFLAGSRQAVKATPTTADPTVPKGAAKASSDSRKTPAML